ncbi:N-acetylgalactosamine kinase isoform X2 [Cylas formicarius]|uniref:N-acetylgalactosamine kinase isoform X2 n=1 Tax=Cylas formicarius TaxID=197179 RepID=UPI002958C6FD|nr:N-acetylgalactosamine kinase isoform X2 [Cylas formicarius]
MADEKVPIRYSTLTGAQIQVGAAFTSLFGRDPDFYARVPGRVNLIGEHIDYCGYGVCPMALNQHIFIAAFVTDSDRTLELRNFDAKYEKYRCDLNDIEITVEGKAPHWYQYFLCGVKGVLEALPMENVKGLRVMVSGNVPQGAGLSSSSALVSAAALTAAYAFGMPLHKEKLAQLCANSERYIGTQGGGMDQAIAFLATDGCAKLIEFDPLKATDVRLPKGAVFVIAHSMTNLNKAATGDFNCRVVECRLAAQIMAKRRGLDWAQLKRLGELQKALQLDLQEMIALVETVLDKESYTKVDVLSELDTAAEQLEVTSLTPNTKHIDCFKLKQRALHVFNALRVRKFYETCQKGSGDDDSLATLGTLMSESHDSLRDLYECSHPQLDRIVTLSKGLTLGTRLTGAGWGGCTVSLVAPDNVHRYVEFLKENFYAPLGVKSDFEDIVFPTFPEWGAQILLC